MIIYDYICICIRICGCVVYNILQHNVAVCVRMGTSAPLCTAPFGGKFTIFQFTVQPRMSTPTSTRWNRVASENLRSDLSFSDLKTSRRIRNHRLRRKKNGCIVFIESILCWINSMPDTSCQSSYDFWHFYPWFLDPFRSIHRAELSNSSIPGYKNSPPRRRKTSHLATLWVFKVWKTMENHHFLLGLSFINGHLYHR